MLILYISILRLSSAACVATSRPLFLFANIGALFKSERVIIDGVSLQASPSTCIGIVFDVTILALLHCVIQVP